MRVLLAFLLTLAPALTTADPVAPPSPEQLRKVANELVAKWLAAQNRGDFAAYQALYAESFTGTKRVGKVAKTFDRAAWLADRKSMFAAEQRVAARDLVVTLSPPMITLDFVQTWEQGTFADTGPKRMIVDLYRPTAAIVSEELLSSRQILAGKACTRALFPDGKNGRIGPGRDDAKIVGVETFDLGTQLFGCAVAHRDNDGESTATELAVLVREGKAWQELGRERLDQPDDVEAPGGPGAGATYHKLELSTLTVGKLEALLIVEQERRETAEMSDSGKRSVRLLRATREGLAQVLDYASTWSRGESEEATTCSIDTLERRTKGWLDLELTCVESTASWHDDDPADRGVRETPEVTTYRWNGSTYEERRRKRGRTVKQ